MGQKLSNGQLIVETRNFLQWEPLQILQETSYERDIYFRKKPEIN